MVSFFRYNPATPLIEAEKIAAYLLTDLEIREGFINLVVHGFEGNFTDEARKKPALARAISTLEEQNRRKLYSGDIADPQSEAVVRSAKIAQTFNLTQPRDYIACRISATLLEPPLRAFVLDNPGQSFREKVRQETSRMSMRLLALQSRVRKTGDTSYSATNHATGFAETSERVFSNKVLVGPDIFHGNFMNKHNKDPWCNFFGGYEIAGIRYSMTFVITNPDLQHGSTVNTRYKALALPDRRFYELLMNVLHDVNSPQAAVRAAENYLGRLSCFAGMENHDYIHSKTLNAKSNEFLVPKFSTLRALEVQLPEELLARYAREAPKDDSLKDNGINHPTMEAFSMQANADAWEEIISTDRSGRIIDTITRGYVSAMADAITLCRHIESEQKHLLESGLNLESMRYYMAYITLKPIITAVDYKHIDENKVYDLPQGKYSVTSALRELGIDYRDIRSDVHARHPETLWLHNGTFNELCLLGGYDSVPTFLSKQFGLLNVLGVVER